MCAATTDRTRLTPDEPPRRQDPHAESCDYCGSTALEWVKCKLICRNCRQINKSCADL
jgi:hypothetical protein